MNHIELKKLGIPGKIPEFTLKCPKTALMIIDMYYRGIDRSYGFGKKAELLGLTKELDYYYNRIQNLVIPNLMKLLETCRSNKMEIIHITVGSITEDGRDASWRYQKWGILTKDNKELDIIEPLSPLKNEIVLYKTTSGAFNSTQAEQVLKNIGIEYLIIGGIVTGNCVETTVRDACDLGFKVYLVEDACAGLTQESHEYAIQHLHLNYAHVKSTNEVISEINNSK